VTHGGTQRAWLFPFAGWQQSSQGKAKPATPKLLNVSRTPKHPPPAQPHLLQTQMQNSYTPSFIGTGITQKNPTEPGWEDTPYSVNSHFI
jgi:hypothetical protein